MKVLPDGIFAPSLVGSAWPGVRWNYATRMWVTVSV